MSVHALALPLPLSLATSVRRRYLRSVHLERDAHTADALDEYIMTPQARAILRRVLDGLDDPHGTRAWTLTGPYGTGKSAFALFISVLLADTTPRGDRMRAVLTTADPSLAGMLDRVRARGKARPFLPLHMTGDRVSVANCLVRGLRDALTRIAPYNRDDRFTALLATLVAAPDTTTSGQVVEWIAAAAEHLIATGRYGGLLILLDEMGKPLEHAVRQPGKSDLFLLQEIAEYANRSGDTPVMFMGILHQSFERYGAQADTTTRNEWAKVQGRFEDIAFQEPPEQMMRLIAAAISATPDAVEREQVQRAVERTGAAFLPPGMPFEEFGELAVRSFPLHPSALVTLPYLFRRFAQNDRSLFAYLGSQEPFSFEKVRAARVITDDADSFIRLPDLYDYFIANFGAALSTHRHARRWIEAMETLEQRKGGDAHENAIIKTIGVLSSASEISHLSCTRDAIAWAIAPTDLDYGQVLSTLEHLRDQSVVTHRRYNDTYRLWDGSDVDLDARLAEAQRNCPATVSVAAALHAVAPPRPLVASRHSYEHGTLRAFSVQYVDGHAVETFTPPLLAENGVLICFLPQSLEESERCCEWAVRETVARPDLVVAVPEQFPQLLVPLTALRELHWVRDNTPELAGDLVARREVHAQIAELDAVVREQTEQLLRTGLTDRAAACRWYANGTQQTTVARGGLARLLSDAADTRYPQSPRVWNELINRRSLSSAAAAGRRDLIQAMLTEGGKERLGFVGFGPEVSMYESVLHATGLHRPTETERWAFGAVPEEDPKRLRPVWNALAAAIFPEVPAPVSVAELQSRLGDAPYGLTNGVFPVLLCAFMQAHPDETSLYRDGSFLPEPGIADWEVLMRRPELFAVAGCRVTGERAAVVERLARGFDVAPAVLPIVRALTRMYRQLPAHTQKTRNVPEAARNLRDAIARARMPELFLFHDLPTALGCPPLVESTANDEVIEAFFVQLNAALQALAAATPTAITGARDTLLAACGFAPDAEGWTAFRTKARELDGTFTHPALAPVIRRAALVGDDDAVVDSVLAAVITRPPASWTDADAERFTAQAQQVGRVFREFTAPARPIVAAPPVSSASPPSDFPLPLPITDLALVKRVRDVLPTDIPPQTLCVALRVLLAQLEREEEESHVDAR